MSILSKLFPQPSPPMMVRSSIRGATGLSRAAVADHYRRNGLFGRDSDLNSAEQIMVQSRLGPLPGVPQAPAPAWSAARLKSPQLQILADHVDALVAGRDTRDSSARLQLGGFRPAALSEVECTVHNVQEIFGPRAMPAKADLHETVIAESALARAA